ncbi:MAG: LPS export ABC transporter permease LptG [Gammaproteobacteria bacterium]|nr:LPS export ABC transporter permease LptG [Gammaproteobacteria bacterium]
MDRYIARIVMISIASVLVVLVAVFSFFKFIDELDQVGRGGYGILTIVEFVFFSTPRLTYELFPIAALIGTLIGLGTLVRNSEMIVIRTSGVSLARIVLSVMKLGSVFVLASLVVGEFIAPPSEEVAQHRKSIATTNQIALRTAGGFWARDGRSYINIRRVLPGNRVEGVYIYEFDDQNRLRVSTSARQAYYKQGRWVLEKINQTVFDADRVRKRRMEHAPWDSLLDPKLINLAAINPQHLSMINLYNYIRFREANGQNSRYYRHALWAKLSYPLATGVMVFLAIPIVLVTAQKAGIGQRVVIGSCIGLVFHIINKAAGSLGVVFDLSPVLSAMFPTAATFLAAVLLMRRVH